jgi:hypothetical protein
MWLFKGKIDILSFIGFLGFLINIMLCLLFCMSSDAKGWEKYCT